MAPLARMHARLQAVRTRAYNRSPVSALLAPSGSGLLDAPVAQAEFLAVDTETNGLARERCELTEVGAVLVGGGDLHGRWGSLVGVAQPLGAGIQRFTGITQGMLDGAPPPEAVLPQLADRLRGRVLVAHNARFDERVLRQAFERAGVRWPNPPVLCTVALARRLAPLQQRRGLAALADGLGIEVGEVHRALPDAETCARILCALFGRLCAHAQTVGEAVALLGPRRAPARRRPPKRLAGKRPDLKGLPKDPGVYIFRDADGRPLYVGKSVCLRTRARAHFTTPSTWTGEAEHVDYQATHSELGALVLENRLIKALKPPGNVQLKREPDGFVYLRCRLDIAYPILEVAHEPAPGNAVCVGPMRGRMAAQELVEQLNSLFGLRHCGRGLPRRLHPSAYGQMGRCLSPCLGDLDPNLYRERLDAALGLFGSTEDGGAALLAHVERQMREAAAAQRFERAAWLARRLRRLESLLRRLGGVLRAAHAGARLVLAPHPARDGAYDAFWIVGGRVADWGPLPADPVEVAARTTVALRRRPPRSQGGWLPADELAESRIVGAWLAGHDAASLELDPAPDARALAGFVAGV
ncbi:MAG: polymerase subunit epsilon [Solirubrobacteraceae bacterium]|jgi:DNA polymerase-3 subunit epsilon|nr:polymerase subunit epsilon [Solirubrobacteraceae bacterium]